MWDSVYDFYTIISIFGTFSAVVLGVGIVMKEPLVLAFACLMGVTTIIAATSISISEPIKPVTAADCSRAVVNARSGTPEAIKYYRTISDRCATLIKPPVPWVPATVR